MNEKKPDKKIGGQIFLFFALVLVVFILLLQGKDLKEVIRTVQNASLPFLVIAACVASTFILCEATNLRVMLKSFGYQIGIRQSIKYAATGFFFSSVTPSSTGGQPMQLYLMNKDHILISHGSLALLIELVSFQTIAFICEIAAVIMLLTTDLSMHLNMWILAGIGFVFNGLFIFFLLIVIFSKRLGGKLTSILEKIIRKLPVVSVERKERWISKLDDGMEEFHGCATMVKQNKTVILKVMAVSTVQVICWFSVPYVIYLSLGQSGISYGYILMIQVLVYMISALLPLPGAVGISELAFIQLFGTIYSKDMLTAATLLSRGISFYFLLIVSLMILVASQLKNKRK